MDMILGKSKFQIYLIFSNICCRYTYVFSINKFFTINFFKTNSQPLSLFQ